MNLELCEFPTASGIILPGLLFSPVKPAETILIALHGNGSSGGFYNVAKNNALGQKLTAKGFSYLTFSNTGSHLIQKFDRVNKDGTKDRVQKGVAYELIKDCLEDIDSAVSFVKKKGYRKIFLLGQSTGANKICVYNKYKPENELAGYILTSGGDDSGIYYSQTTPKDFQKVIQISREKIKKGKGGDLASPAVSNLLISYASLLDQIDPDGDYNTFPFYWLIKGTKIMNKEALGEFSAITKPALVIYGDSDEYCYQGVHKCMTLLREKVTGRINFQFQVVSGTGHSFDGREEELAEQIVKWLLIHN